MTDAHEITRLSWTHALTTVMQYSYRCTYPVAGVVWCEVVFCNPRGGFYLEYSCTANITSKAKQSNANNCKTREATQTKARQSKAKPSNVKQCWAKQCKATQLNENQSKEKQSNANAKRSKAKQSKAMQSNTNQCKAVRRLWRCHV